MRISQANRSELIVILYEIFFIYMQDAKQALTGDKDCAAANDALRNASQVLEHLKNALDFKYDVSRELYPLYVFGQREIAKVMVHAEADRIDGITDFIRPLQEAFIEVAKQDTSATVMKNTEKVVAGYTYGRSDINAMPADAGSSRGFLA